MAPTAGGVVRTAAALGRSALAALGGGVRERVVGLVFSNLKLTLVLLLTSLGLLLTLVVLPVLVVVFTMSVGVSHGLRLDVPAAVAAPPGPPLAPGTLACPVPGSYVTQPFGPSELSGEPAMFGYAHFHAGIDLGAAQGTPIRAAEAGQVVQAAGQTNSLGFLVGYGNLVRIQANSGRIDYYGHMVDFAVQRGDIVEADQVIGYVGTTGYSTGPHLHFEVRVGGAPVDPAPFLRPC
ncbi:MAG TPA: M23 family metallopeptidase [Candidatus Dormibacteraeota bacterium]|nr:M23 family metallopeptidase [Candidatus Dormibacteraeota bacterium]